MFKCFFLVILIMVGSIHKAMLRYIKEGIFDAFYTCSTSGAYYRISFFGDAPSFHINVTRDDAQVELKDEYDVTFLSMWYSPPPSKKHRFREEIYRKYCRVFRRKFGGKYIGGCFVDVNGQYCNFFGSNIYNLYFDLENNFIYPFLSRLLNRNFRVISCNSFRIQTPHITLDYVGNFDYRNRFYFSDEEVEFTIDCKKPEESIRKAIRFILRKL